MSQLLALSFDTPASPTITLKAPADGGAPHPAGWGMAWYPPGDRGAMIVKDPGEAADSSITRMLESWSRFRSTVFLCHLYGASSRRRHEDTQPFVRIYGRRQWSLCHNGFLGRGFAETLGLGDDPMFEPLGHTDSEHVLCWLLDRLRREGIGALPDLGWERLLQWFGEVDALGTFNLLLSDGDFLIAYQDSSGFNPLHWTRWLPPHESSVLEDEDLVVDLGDPFDESRTAVVVSTQPLYGQAWSRLDNGSLLVARHGEVIWLGSGQPSPTIVPGTRERPPAPVRVPAEYEVTHETVYHYETPVEVSQHVLRLRPISDRTQHVVAFDLETEPTGFLREFEDVFGNQAHRLDLDGSFDTLRILSRSRVVLDEIHRDMRETSKRSTLPVPWMPWQREVLVPFLLPPELPAPQLQELFEYAMSFAERQDFDLIETIEDINQVLHSEWTYEPGSTTVETTPWDVYVSRRGVCQDFANLMICMARLLGLPARYRVGYVDTSVAAVRTLPDASHAWVELYLPRIGWRGFDPTNGTLVGTEHVRVACGRNYRDATPTSGTIYRGGLGESLSIDVRIRRGGETRAG